MAEHDWHLFDDERGYEVRQLDDDTFELRDATGEMWTLDAAEFDQVRSEGANPRDIP